MNIEPKAKIGEVVNIVDCDYVQTSYGFNVVHLASKMHGDLLNYYVHDIKVTISLRTGKTEYSYLIGLNEKFDKQWSYVGWVSDRKIQAANVCC